MASTEFATRSHKGAGFLFFLSFALLAAAAGFAFAPQFSWQATKIARQAAEFGLHGGNLLVGGLVLLGLGLVARVASSAPSAPDTSSVTDALQNDLQAMNEQFSTKLGQLRTSVLQLSESLSTVSAQQQAQLESSSEQGHSDHSQDAVFRLAASLDKLHAHLDERVHALDLQMRSSFEALLSTSQDVRRMLGHQHSAPAAHGSVQHGHGSTPQAAPGLDFYETMQKLDAIAGSEGAQSGGHGHQPQAPFPSQGHGDALDALLPEEYRDRY